ncbi:MAG: mevalonate kinase [Deltaproteobacteria bacterium]|nr:mevalonate kinase [Deltaproteobacteria bacterium]
MARAFGKLILFGEHAVVHGVAAIACGLERGLVAEVTPVGLDHSSLDLVGRRASEREDSPLGRAFTALLSAGVGRPRAAVHATVQGELPPGMNLGFSAAAAVALARALAEAGTGDDAASVQARADAWERVFHGNPSGIDVAAALHGGVIRYRRGEPVVPLSMGASVRLCVGLSGTKPGPTSVMVESVAEQRRRDPASFERALGSIADLVARAEVALAAGRTADLGQLMSINHGLLAAWGLSTESLDELCVSALTSGALGAKLTGAGGGGAMVALLGAGDSPEAVAVGRRTREAWRVLGFDGFEVVVGAS